MRASKLVAALAALALTVPLAAAPVVRAGGFAAGFQFLGTVAGIGNVASSALALGGGNGGIFDSGNAEGWVIQCVTCAANQTLSVTRQGWTATTPPTPTTVTDTFTIVQPLRGPISPGPGAFVVNSQNLWALSDYVLASDTIGGVVNNSTLSAPKPVCNFSEADRIVIGNSLHIGVVCFSRDGRNQSQIAAAVVRATDGTTTVTATATAMQKSIQYEDSNIVIDYEVTLDTTSLADFSLITVNADVYPWIGDATTTGATSSVLHSTDSAVLKEFSPRFYLKNTLKVAAPPIAYVCPAVVASTGCAVAGSDTTGTWSTTVATAKAAPFLTMSGAFNSSTNASRGILAINGGVGIGNALGDYDGAVMRLGQGTTQLGGSNNLYGEHVAAITITRDPLVTRAQAVLSAPGNVRLKLSSAYAAGTPTLYLRPEITESSIVFTDLSFVRAASAICSSWGPRTNLFFKNVNYNDSNIATTPLNDCNSYWFGVVATNVAGPTFFNGASGTEARIVRGVTATNAGADGQLLLGSTFTNFGGATGTNKAIIAFNRLLGINNGVIIMGDGVAMPDGAALVQNVDEQVSGTTGYSSIYAGSDGGTASVTNLIMQYNSFAGAHVWGRQFLGYDSNTGTNNGVYRKYKFWSFLGNIFTAIYSKQDVFAGNQAQGTASGLGAANNRTGGWAMHNGVGWNGNVSTNNQGDHFGTGFTQAAKPGIGLGNDGFLLESLGWNGKFPTVLGGASYLYNRLDPLFVVDGGVTVNSSGAATNGPGGGDYRLRKVVNGYAADSPCLRAVPQAASALPWGLDGTARPTSGGDSCGAYP